MAMMGVRGFGLVAGGNGMAGSGFWRLDSWRRIRSVAWKPFRRGI